MERLCLKCGSNLKGRSDKKFCSIQCKSEYNNQRKSETEKDIIETNRILRKNRKILSMLSPEGKTTIRKAVLDELGFNYQYFTSIFNLKNGGQYFFCYEYGFMPIINNGVERAVIVIKQDYMQDRNNPW